MRRDLVPVTETGFVQNVWTMETEGDIANLDKSVLRDVPPGWINSVRWVDDRRVIIEPVQLGALLASMGLQAVPLTPRATPTLDPALAPPADNQTPPPNADDDGLDKKPEAELYKLCGLAGVPYAKGKTPRAKMVAELRAKAAADLAAAAAGGG